MRIYIIILILFIAEFSCAQFVQGDSVRIENSKKHLEFALANEGKKVGNGVCMDLIIEAIKKSHPNDYKSIINNNPNPFLIKDSTNIIPGDVVIFKNVIRGKKEPYDTIFNHAGIVIHVEKDMFYYANQNVGDRKKDKKIKVENENKITKYVFANSKVEFYVLPYNDVKGGKIYFYRF